ncbi:MULTISPECIES: hypothetical protein [unclassified Sphingobacterium]|uniref:hypothetical protein n=1 Tax=unclassified Sphingobacterium TaxID=2609468 RepID=UPI0025CEA9FD|nr:MULTISPECIES: hypothetical protein [unclassified Sphingobacterium]
MKNNSNYQEELYAIANTLLLYYQNLPTLSFMRGKLGVAALFYKFSESSQHVHYANIADNIIRESFISFKTKKSTIFDWLEIGIGISYLIKHKFVDDDLISIVEDSKKLLLNVRPKIVKSIADSSELAWLGVYFLCTSENIRSPDSIMIDKSLSFFENFGTFIDFPQKETGAMLYFLFALITNKEYSKRILGLLKKIDDEIFRADIEFLHYDFRIIFYAFENMAKVYLPKLTDLVGSRTENYSDEYIFMTESFYATIFDIKARSPIPAGIYDLIKEKQGKITNENMSLIDGLAGIGLSLLENSNKSRNLSE